MHKVIAAGLEGEISADSAGTGEWHMGQPPHHGTRAMLAKNNIEYSHTARNLEPEDYNAFELIVTMDDDNYESVAQRGKGRAQVHRFLDFAPDCGHEEVPDPYYSGNFAQTYELCNQAADGLLAYIRRTCSV